MTKDGPASTAQCLFCFEVLLSHFEGSEPPELSKVTQLYEEYEASKAGISSSDDAGAVSASSLTVSSLDRTQDRSPASNSTTGSSKTPDSATRSASRSPASLASDSSASYPVYVTWNTLSGRSKALRGCIGTFEPLPLSQGLRTYSLVSALEDYRFSPIQFGLMPSLGCELTLLSNFEECRDAMDWEIGKHGLKINFVSKGRSMGATYLPHVCPEQGWNKEECFESLMCKAGWEPSGGRSGVRRWLSSGRSADQDTEAEKKPWETVSNLKVVRYQGAHAAADYKEWEEWRAWAKGRL